VSKKLQVKLLWTGVTAAIVVALASLLGQALDIPYYETGSMVVGVIAGVVVGDLKAAKVAASEEQEKE
jgi:ABC-type enterochelin transport system permease subunit